MIKIKFIAIIIILSFFSTHGFSQINIQFSKREIENQFLNFDKKFDSKSNINEGNVKSTFKFLKNKEKSPYLGAGLSAILPGAGEFYAESYLKAAIFFLAEAGLWTTYAVFTQKGNDQEEYYQNFANENWNVRKYAEWLVQEGFSGSSEINPDEPDLEVLRQQINACESQNFSHTLPNYNSQQYYELIGKYQNFVAGWSDADLSQVNKNNYIDYSTPYYEQYATDRQTANDYFDNANTTLIFVVINHVLSAADAAWTVTMFNKELNMKTHLNIDRLYSNSLNKFYLLPKANLSIRF